jgi:exodeoxyribonuclease-3
MPIRIATWNVNSIRLRIEMVMRISKWVKPDVFCFQEIKCREAEFPFSALKSIGYEHFAINAQKGYHGVAIASRVPIKQIASHDFCKRGEARHINVSLDAPGMSFNDLTIHNFYVPAGGDIPNPEENKKFRHKLDFLEEMRDFFSVLGEQEKNRVVLVGDLNVAPLDCDVWNHKALLSVVSHTAEEVERLESLFHVFGGSDPIRLRWPVPDRIFTWWSYLSPNWALANKGRRLDHIWISSELTKTLGNVEILKEVRGWERPSDHVPILVDLL